MTDTAIATTPIHLDEHSDQVPGFSDRFCQLLNKSGFPEKARYSVGAAKFDVSINTFRNWCVNERPPRKFGMLQAVVQILLEEVPGKYNTDAIVGWLYAGDAVPNPFVKSSIDYVMLGELYAYVRERAADKGVKFDATDAEVRQQIIDRTVSFLSTIKDAGIDSLAKDDKATLNGLIDSMLELAQHKLL